MSEIDDYELEALYAADPDGMTSALISAAAATAAAEVAAQHNARLEEDHARVRQGQAESAGFIAQGELEKKYGKAEAENLLPKIRAKLDENPSLISDDALTSEEASSGSAGSDCCTTSGGNSKTYSTSS